MVKYLISLFLIFSYNFLNCALPTTKKATNTVMTHYIAEATFGKPCDYAEPLFARELSRLERADSNAYNQLARACKSCLQSNRYQSEESKLMQNFAHNVIRRELEQKKHSDFKRKIVNTAGFAVFFIAGIMAQRTWGS